MWHFLLQFQIKWLPFVLSSPIFLLSNKVILLPHKKKHLQRMTVWMLWTSGKRVDTYTTSIQLYGCWLTLSQYSSESRRAQTLWGTGILVETSSWKAKKWMKIGGLIFLCLGELVESIILRFLSKLSWDPFNCSLVFKTFDEPFTCKN